MTGRRHACVANVELRPRTNSPSRRLDRGFGQVHADEIGVNSRLLQSGEHVPLTASDLEYA